MSFQRCDEPSSHRWQCCMSYILKDETASSTPVTHARKTWKHTTIAQRVMYVLCLLTSCTGSHANESFRRISLTVAFQFYIWVWPFDAHCCHLACISQPLLPQILPQSDPHPCWFERRRHSMANCSIVTDPYDLPFPQNRVPNVLSRTDFATCNWHDSTWRYQQDFFCIWAMWPFDKLLWLLFLLLLS